MLLEHSEHTFKDNIYAFSRVELRSTISMIWVSREECIFDTVITRLGWK